MENPAICFVAQIICSVGPCAHIIKLRPTFITEIPADIIYIGE